MSLVDHIGCWASVRRPVRPHAGALFLDRDGVVVEEVNYLWRVADMRISPAAPAVIATANRANIPVVMVTNQSGVARGRFGWADFEILQTELDTRLAKSGAHIDAVFACGFHETGAGALGHPDHPWRKPNPGMFLAALERMEIDLASSIVVGDRAGDLAAGRAAGLRQGVHVATGHGTAAERAAALALGRPGFQVTLAADIAGVLPYLAERAGLSC